ncbi:uncharacterized protein LOC135681910 isoform X2 [Rhopilema esculentum]|uniref:uncharacterized protein LOC135681910 isoform X2 n=1 Tax=Rhopilema esculentum TaxID=499914 RepID=UPI0031D01E4F
MLISVGMADHFDRIPEQNFQPRVNSLSGRPELGIGQGFYANNLSFLQRSDTLASGSSTSSHENISVLSFKGDGLPMYTTFAGLRLSTRRRPRRKGSKRRVYNNRISLTEAQVARNCGQEADNGENGEQDIDLGDDGDEDTNMSIAEDEFEDNYRVSMNEIDENVVIESGYKTANTLKKFCVVERVPVEFLDAVHWLYSCSCSVSLQQLIKGLSRKIFQEYNDFKHQFDESYKYCLHVKVLKSIIESWDAVEGLTAANCLDEAVVEHWYTKERPKIVELPFSNDALICIRPPDLGFAVVGMDKRGFFCSFCEKGNRSCAHVRCLQAFIKKETDMVPEFVLEMLSSHERISSTFQRLYSKSAISRRAIFDKVLPSQVDIFKGFLNNTFDATNKDDLKLYPDVEKGNCLSCHADLLEETFWHNDKKNLFTLKNVFNVSVPYFKCSNHECGRLTDFDGGAKGILNQGDFLVAHDVLRDYMQHFLKGHSQSLISYLEVWKSNLSFSGYEKGPFLNYQQWRCSWYSFLELLDIDYTFGFQCQICGPYPNVVICDATTLGFRRHYARQVDVNIENERQTVRLKGSDFSDRVFMRHPKARNLLRKFAKRRQLELEERLELDRLLDENHKVLYNLLVYFEQLYGGALHIHEEIWVLFRCISSVSPVSSYFPCSETLKSLLEKLDEGMVIRENPEAFMQLQKCAPVIFAVLKVLPPVSVPSRLMQLFKELSARAWSCFSTAQHTLGPVAGNVGNSDLSFFPSWPKLCERGVYVKDHRQPSSAENCTKLYKGHPNLLPGIFTIYCEHEICYGFQVMEHQESPNIPYTVIRTRFPSAPDAIIYDNCCNLHQYCLNRDPSYFRTCKFLVDRFHWKNHTGCAESYDVSRYPRFEGINTQINEQRNSTLKVLKSQLSYMNKKNFINHLTKTSPLGGISGIKV